MSTITVTVTVDTDSEVVLARAADQLREKVESLELVLDGTTTQTGHTVTQVKVKK